VYNHTNKNETGVSMKTLKVSAEIWKRLKMLAAEKETTMGKLIEEMLNECTK